MKTQKYIKFLLIGFLLFSIKPVFSQGAAINTSGNVAAPSAMLDVSSSVSGLLIPRLSDNEMNNISNAATGLLIYNTDCNNFYYYNGISWNAVNPIIPEVYINTTSNLVCPNSNVTFTAIALNGGSSPTYIWKVNGIPVGNNSNTYTTNTLINGDNVSCELISNASCAIINLAVSNIINMSVSSLNIGDSYAGGIIFYLDSTCWHGLVCAPSDQSSGATWGCLGTSIPGTLHDIGEGQANTSLILANCTTSGISAQICNNYGAGWFLPSRLELDLIYKNLHFYGIGNFSNVRYWSSTEFSNNNVWAVNFNTGASVNSGTKDLNYRVRAVKSF